jgi:hypothetical protein
MIKWVERGILLAAILSMLFVWPYGGIREDKKDSSLSEDYGYTEPLQVGEYASQYFVAETLIPACVLPMLTRIPFPERDVSFILTCTMAIPCPVSRVSRS